MSEGVDRLEGLPIDDLRRMDDEAYWCMKRAEERHEKVAHALGKAVKNRALQDAKDERRRRKP